MPKYPFNLKYGIIPVNVELHGAKVLTSRMVLDTGATFTIISWGIADLLGYNPKSASEIKIITASGTEAVKTLNIKRIKALGAEITNLKIVCHDLPSDSGVDGLLGLDFLKHFNLFINFKDKFVELY